MTPFDTTAKGIEVHWNVEAQAITIRPEDTLVFHLPAHMCHEDAMGFTDQARTMQPDTSMPDIVPLRPRTYPYRLVTRPKPPIIVGSVFTMSGPEVPPAWLGEFRVLSEDAEGFLCEKLGPLPADAETAFGQQTAVIVEGHAVFTTQEAQD